MRSRTNSIAPSGASWASTDTVATRDPDRDQDPVVRTTGNQAGQVIPAGREPTHEQQIMVLEVTPRPRES